MAVINRKYGYLFLAEPYCASRSIEQALLIHDGSWHMNAWTHETFEKLIQLEEITRHEPLFKFSVVRNPADYLVTKYHHLTSWHGRGFEAFLAEQRSPLFLHADTVDRVVRYERLESELNAVLESRGAPEVKLQTIGQTPGKKSYRSYYESHNAQDLIHGRIEFRTYGYAYP